MRWFGRPSNWDASTDLGDVHAWIVARNVERFDVPLDDQECYWMAKSVCKISRKNLTSGQAQQNFGFIQAAKGRRSGEVRRKGTPLELDRAPWEAEGVSRRTWYYRQVGPTHRTTWGSQTIGRGLYAEIMQLLYGAGRRP